MTVHLKYKQFMIVDCEASLTSLSYSEVFYSVRMVCVHVIECLFSFFLAQTCALKAVKNVVAMVSVPYPSSSVPKLHPFL